jgi:phosphoribosyl-ATP pyrophosphohydrolase/phosphoribosyl-AMP cyclohydrolase
VRLETAADLDALRFDERDGLLPVIAQDADTGEVLMLGWANREALERTLADGTQWFWSRSRRRLWRKGETSGNTLRLAALDTDCDADTVLARVAPAGPTCHTGARSCFGAPPVLAALGDVIRDRRDRPDAAGHTRRLLGDANLRRKKLGEEAVELAMACADGDRARITAEAADLLYHVLVACAAEGVGEADILSELRGRRGGGR